MKDQTGTILQFPISRIVRQPGALLKPATATRQRRKAKPDPVVEPTESASQAIAEVVHHGSVVDAVVRGRIERGEREIFERATCMRASPSGKDLVEARGELIIESFDGRCENVIFTPDDNDLDDAEIYPKNIVRDGAVIEIQSSSARWVFVVE